MSINTEITRLSGAKSDLKTFLTDNGVTVPAGTKIDGLVALLESVQTGGVEVFEGSGLTWETGSFTVASTQTSGNFVLTHNLEKKPSKVILYAIENFTTVGNIITSLPYDENNASYPGRIYTLALTSSNTTRFGNQISIDSADPYSVSIPCSTSCLLSAGSTYVYAIGG